MTSPAPGRAPAPRWEPRSAGVELRGAAQIGALLGRAAHAHAMLTVRIGSSIETYSSLLLMVDVRNGSLYLDAPYPPVPALVRRGVEFRVGGRLEGGRFEFRSTVDEAVVLDGGAAVRIVFPQQVSYYERRANFRLAIPAGYSLSPLLLTGPDGAVRGRIVDLSQLGAGALVGAPPPADVGGMLSCQLTLPNTLVHADVEVRSQAQNLGNLRLGLMFAALSGEQEAKIAAAIGVIQRQLIRTTASRG